MQETSSAEEGAVAEDLRSSEQSSVQVSTFMSQDFPNDAEGDALRRIASHGSDLSKPMHFDFQVAVPDEAAAKNLAQAAQKLGYRAAIYNSPECSLP